MSALSDQYVRTTEDVFTILHHAKVEPQELCPITQVLYVTDKLRSTQLLELNDDLSNALSVGETISFCGTPESEAVLCTDSKTYDVKIAETSNSLLIVPDLKFYDDLSKEGKHCLVKKEIVSVHYTYLELRKIKPKTRLLMYLLERKNYNGKELEPDCYSLSDGYYTTESLLGEIQISKQELLDALEQLGAFDVEGYWRVLGFEYHFRSLSLVLNIIDEHSWNYDAIPIGQILLLLRELLPDVITNYIFDLYFTSSGVFGDDGEELCELRENKVCRFLGEALLKSVVRLSLNNFMETWQLSVPEGMTVDLNLIKELCIIEKESNSEKLIAYFPEYKLSEDIQERFSELFKAKEKWTYEEIAPFIQKLTSEKENVKAVLTKYTRPSRSGNILYYGARHGK